MQKESKDLSLIDFENRPRSTYKYFDVRDYVKIYDVFSEELCNNVKSKLVSAEWQNHSYYDPIDHKEIVLDHDYSICSLSDEDPDIDIIMKGIWSSLFTYVSSLEYQEWFPSWSGYSFVRFNRVEQNKKIMRHYDAIKRLFEGKIRGDPFLSIVGKINDDYEGGEFVMWEDTVIDLKPGQLMIFPSNFMYPHQVDTVTKGTRYSFVSWAY